MNNPIFPWFAQSRRDFLTARHTFKSRDYYASAFFSQQAVEKGLKAIYLQKFSKLWKIHDLPALAKGVQAPQEIIQKCAELTPVYFTIRYPEADEIPFKRINKQEAERLLHITKEVLEWIKQNIS